MQDEQRTDIQDEEQTDIQDEQGTEERKIIPPENKAIRFVILGIPYSIKPTDELTGEDIDVLVSYVKQRIERYMQKGYDQTRIPILVAFDIANELRELQKFYELPINRAIDKLKFVLEPE
ncbi:cell division protein ZapA [Candidatus Poribacteria bacterium]|nr:cell division protein ZapA [Candidatus Poribacteria bacterium]